MAHTSDTQIMWKLALILDGVLEHESTITQNEMGCKQCTAHGFVHLSHSYLPLSHHWLLARRCVPITQSHWSKFFCWQNNFYSLQVKSEVPAIRRTIHQYIFYIFWLLLQHYGAWTSLEEPVQLGLSYHCKWYIVLLRGHCWNSIHSLHHPIMAVALLHVGLSMLAL